MRWILIAAIILLFALANAQAKNCGGSIACNCGDTVTADYTFLSDLNDGSQSICHGSGLIVIGENIIIDCAGFSIKGQGNSEVADHFKGIKTARGTMVKNCKISDFSGPNDTAIYGYGYYSAEDNEIFDNYRGIFTIAMGGPCHFLRNEIHHNLYPLIIDETLNVEIGYNHVHHNKNGIEPGVMTVWSENLDYWPKDYGNVHNNLIEYNEGKGLWIYFSYSQVKDNIIRYNGSGLGYNIKKIVYRVWDNGNVREIEGWRENGKKVGNHNEITGNQIYGNEDYDFKIFWDTGSVKDFVNTIENNTAGGKPVYFFFEESNLSFTGLNAHSFYCISCQNISISDSTIKDLYLFDTNNSTFTNTLFTEGEYGIYLYDSHQNHFNGYQITNTLRDIYKFNSEDNFFNGTDCTDADDDDICDELDNCEQYNPDQRDWNDDEIGDQCDEKMGCLADLDGNGIVATRRPSDRAIFLANLGRSDCSLATNWCELADIDRDGIVGVKDNEIFNTEFWHPLRYIGCDCSNTPELCDGLDNDCDMEIDEGCQCVNQTTRECTGENQCKICSETCIQGIWSLREETGNRENKTACVLSETLKEKDGKENQFLIKLLQENKQEKKSKFSLKEQSNTGQPGRLPFAIGSLALFGIAAGNLARKKRGQAGLEYLLTYGWAIILIATVISLLVIVIVVPVDETAFYSSKPTQFLLKGGNATDSTMQVKLQNITGGGVKITMVELPANYQTGLCQLNGNQLSSGEQITPGIELGPGSEMFIECWNLQKATGTITIEYNDFAGLQNKFDIVIKKPGEKAANLGICCEGTCMPKGSC